MNRNGHYWTPQEEGLILLRLAEGKTLEQIATEVGRSQIAVGWRRDGMIRKLFYGGRSCSMLAVLFQTTVEEIEHALRNGYPISPNCL